MSSENIFDTYHPYQLRQIFLEKNWPLEFKSAIHQEIAYELFSSWLENVDDETYNEKVRLIVENLTYGFEDEDGNEMLEFNTLES